MGIPILAQPKGNPTDVYNVAVRRGAKNLDFLRAYLNRLYQRGRETAINSDLAVAQADLETGAFTSARYVEDGNVAGFGVFDDGTNEGHQFTAERAADGHLAHLGLYAGKKDIPADMIEADARWDAAIAEKKFGVAHTSDDLGNGNWATDPIYNTKLPVRYAAYFGPYEDQTMASFTPITVRQRLLPSNMKNFPGLLLDTSGDLWVTVHETGNTNTNATAAAEASFVNQGGGPGNVSYHFAVDEKEAWQMLKLNRVGWHAGDGCDNRAVDTGCFRSVAIETVVRDGNRYAAQTRANLITLIAMIMTGHPSIDFGGTDFRRFSPARIAPHNKWSLEGKWCPKFMLDDGYFWTIRSRVEALLGSVPIEGAINIGDLVKVVAEDGLNLREGPGTNFKLVTTLPLGFTATVKDGPTNADGFGWVDLILPEQQGTGWVVGSNPDWLIEVEKAPAPKPEPTPQYKPRVVIPELQAEKDPEPELRKFTFEGKAYTAFPVEWRVRTKGNHQRLQKPDMTAVEVGPWIIEGEEYDVEYVVINHEHPEAPYGLTPFGTFVWLGSAEIIAK